MPWAFSVLIIFDFFFFVSESLFLHQLAVAVLLDLCAKNKMADYQIKGDEVDVFSEKNMYFYGFKGLYAHLASWWDIGPLSCHMKKAISNFFRNFSQKALAGLEIKS